MPPYSEKNNALIKKVLSDPEHFPEEFKSWVASQLFSGSTLQLDRARLPKEVQPAYVSNLVAGPPGTPFHNQLWIATDVDANGACWSFRYNKLSGSAYKWEFIGGTPLFSEVVNGENSTSATYVALTTGGPAIQLARAGDYDVEIGAKFDTNANATTMYMSYDIGATGAIDADAVLGAGSNVANSVIASSVRPRRKTGLAAAVILTAKYRTNNVVTVQFTNRWMRITPVRIS